MGGLIVDSDLSGRRIWYSSALSNFCAWALAISILLLLLVAPWFWATLRRVALVGWLLAFASLLYVLLRGVHMVESMPHNCCWSQRLGRVMIVIERARLAVAQLSAVGVSDSGVRSFGFVSAFDIRHSSFRKLL